MSPVPGYSAMLNRLQRLPKPVLAAMNGDAMGEASSSVSPATSVLVSVGIIGTVFRETKLGLIPEVTERAPRLIGLAKAVEFILRGRIVSPEDALALGLVHELTDDALLRCRELAMELAAMPGTALARAKRSVYEGFEVHLEGGLAIENAAFLDVMLSEDAGRLMEKYVALPLEERRGWLDREGRKKVELDG